MRILFLALDVDLTAPRGDAVHVLELVRNLTTLGHEVRLMAGGRPPDSEPFRFSPAPRSTWRQLLLAFRLARGWADVVYERRTSPKVAWTISSLTGIPFVVEINGVLREEVHASATRNFTGSVRVRLRRRMLRQAAAVVAVSEGVRRSIITDLGVGDDRVWTVPNGANTEVFRPMDKLESRRSLGIRPTDRVICYVRSLAPWQGVRHLLAASARLKHKGVEQMVLILGTGPEESHLKAYAEKLGISTSVQFVGAPSNSRVPVYVNAADVCTAPFETTRRASPIKIFEYLACGKPVVASDVDEVGSFLRQTGSGVVVEPANPEVLSEAIEWLFRHPAESDLMGLRGRAAVQRTRSWATTAAGVAGVLGKAVSRKREQAVAG